MGCFIRDVRKDLSAPNMKFVIGTIGISGDKDQNQVKLAKAQGAPAEMPEFKDNVAVVYTAKYWDHKLAAAAGKMKWVNKKMGFRYRDGVKKGGPKAKEIRARYIKEKGATAEEVELAGKGVSNGAYHYLGSAKIYSRIGKAFAEAMIDLEKK